MYKDIITDEDSTIGYNKIFTDYYSKGNISIERMTALKLFMVANCTCDMYLNIESLLDDKALLFMSEVYYIKYKGLIRDNQVDEILDKVISGYTLIDLIKLFCKLTNLKCKTSLIHEVVKSYKNSIIDMNRLSIISTLLIISKSNKYRLVDIACDLKSDNDYRNYIIYKTLIEKKSSKCYFRLFNSALNLDKLDNHLVKLIMNYLNAVDTIYSGKLNKDIPNLFNIFNIEATEDTIMDLTDYFIIYLYGININDSKIISIKERIFADKVIHC